jgi:hypothetical protein
MVKSDGLGSLISGRFLDCRSDRVVRQHQEFASNHNRQQIVKIPSPGNCQIEASARIISLQLLGLGSGFILNSSAIANFSSGASRLLISLFAFNYA